MAVVSAKVVDGRLKVHVELNEKFNPNHGPDGRFTTYGAHGSIVTPSGESVYDMPGGKPPPEPQKPKYSKMSGSELASELQEMTKKREDEKKTEAKDRKKFDGEFKKLRSEQEALERVGSPAEIEAASKAVTEAYEQHGWNSEQRKNASAEKERLTAAKDQDAWSDYKKKIDAKGKEIQDFENTCREKNKVLKDAIDDALKLDPEDRVSLKPMGKEATSAAAKAGVKRFEELVSKEALRGRESVSFNKAGDGRAYYNEGGGVYLDNVGRGGTTTVVHELGHHLEHSNPDANSAMVAFRRRVTDGAKTESLRKLNKSYREDEVYRQRTDRKKWINPYMGKIYSRSTSTELLSMGLEMLATKPAELLAKDPEFFALVVDAARGNLKGRG